ncbi:YfhO family protein [Sporolactobacillus vineae]|uniref:YfhO family protein n=1 Tax=Sporolactobacillus vineae TaxID=444463 RepID=UPI000288DBB2|nr:YfhO family protein [Sporolactobacillus vineae]
MMPVYIKKLVHSGYLKVFLLCLLTSGIMFLPSLMANKGLFSLVGDFNYQQIPFNILSNRAIKSGDIFWNWYTDLGSSFIGSYSFYTLGSPFFWLSLLFPPFFFPYLVGPMFMLKYCVAGMTSFAYIRRYVKNENYAMIGALLYAFSGFTAVNLMFNHFHDVVALFPLLLFALDRLMIDHKYGWFAIAVALNATVNFFFFMGELVFLILYYCVRFLVGNFRQSIRRLPLILGSGLIGIGMSCFLFLPAILFTLQNPRLDSFLFGPSALVFDGARYLEIIKAFLMPADIMPYQSAIYPSDFTSSGAYLPLFGLSAVISYILWKKKSWMSRMTLATAVMACIPLLNSLLYMLNASYYARWFYMPVLIMALMTAVVLEHREEVQIRGGLLASASATLLLAAFLLFYPWSPSEKNAIFHYETFLVYLALALAGLVGTYFLVWRFRRAKHWLVLTTAAVVLFAGIAGLFNITVTHSVYSYQGPVQTYNTVVKSGQMLKRALPKSQDYRISLSDGGWNLAMVAGLPTINSFTSMVNGSIFQYYQSIGSPRDVKTIIPANDGGINPLLSNRFYVDTVRRPELKLYAQFNNGTNMMYIYENPSIPPIGFTYNLYMTRAQFNRIPDENKNYTLLKAVVLSDGQIRQVKGKLQQISENALLSLGGNSIQQDIAQRRSESSLSFRHDARGFVSKIKADTAKYAFFSVPYDKGWSATVNGKPVKILNSDGFMIVPVTSGVNTIRFHYQTPGLIPGAALTFVSLLIFSGWMVLEKVFRRRSAVHQAGRGTPAFSEKI